jgi:hypothetical protein
MKYQHCVVTCLLENVVKPLGILQSTLHIPVQRIRVLVGELVDLLGGGCMKTFPPRESFKIIQYYTEILSRCSPVCIGDVKVP